MSAAQTSIKQGTPTDDEIERLGKKIETNWIKLGRRLGISDETLQQINQAHDELCEKGYQMLKVWKQKQGSAATYQALCDALKHELLQRQDLAEQFCYGKDAVQDEIETGEASGATAVQVRSCLKRKMSEPHHEPDLKIRVDVENMKQAEPTALLSTEEVLSLIASKYLLTVQPKTMDDYNNFLLYMERMRRTITGVGEGSLVIRVKCDSQESLDELWKEYSSGHLGDIIQRCFVTKEILTELGLAELKLKTTILEEDYKAYKVFFGKESARGNIKNRLEPVANEMKSVNEKMESLMKAKVVENIKENLSQMGNEVKNISEKLYCLTEPSQDEDIIINDLEQIKCEMRNMSEKLDTCMAQREEAKDQGNIKNRLEPVANEMRSVLNEKMESLMKAKDVENIKEKLSQMGNEVKNISEKLDCLTEPIQYKDIIINDLEQIKCEMRNMSEKLYTWVTQREEAKDQEKSREQFMEMKEEIGKITYKLNSLTIRQQLVEKKPWIEDDFDSAELIDGIRQLYKLSEGWLAPFPWCEEFHFHLDDIFTRLKVVSRKKTRGTATTDTVDMSGIFKPHEECPHPRTVLIEGKPGMGKTTYCKKLVYDWATGKQPAEDSFPRFELVLLLRCRDMKSLDLWEAIDDQLLPRDVKEEEKGRFFGFIRHNQSNVLLILDGLDEAPANKLPMFSEIIQGRVLPKCRLVATARHEAGIKVRIHCDTLLEIEGFTGEDAQKFIIKYFKTMDDLAQKLLSKLRNDNNLKEMAVNPLNTALLCLFCEEYGGVFPDSRAKLYVEIVQCVLRRYIKKKGLSENNEDLIEAYKPQLKHLGWTALKGLREGNLDFDESEIGSHSADLPGFGFLSVQPGGSKLRPRRQYSFLHKSFQEFFAAFFLCCQLLDKEISVDSLAADRRYFQELKEVLKFLFGMLAARCEETATALVKSITTEVNKGDDDDCFDVLIECIKECKNENRNSHTTLARVFGSLLTLQTLTISMRVREAEVVILAEALKQNTSLTWLDLSSNNIDDQCTATLAEALKANASLTRLDLSRNYIHDQGAAALANAIKESTSLTRLDLSRNYIYDQGAAALANAIKESTSLTRLDLSRNYIRDQGAAALADAIKESTSLTRLDLSRNYIRDQGAAALADAIKESTSLTRLDLSRNNISDQGTAALADAIKESTSLMRLDLSRNYISDQGAAALADAIKESTSLTRLDLSRNYISDQGAAALADAIKGSTSLTRLDLSRNNISDQGVAALADAIKESTSLTRLDLFRNYIHDQGAAALADAIKESTSLTRLDLSRNYIDDKGAAALADALKVNTTLTELDLSSNRIGDAVVSELHRLKHHNRSIHLDKEPAYYDPDYCATYSESDSDSDSE